MTITTIGRITKDFELKQGASGCIYANFSLAVNDGFGETKKTIFFECTVFGKDAERLVKAKARKGSLIQVIGKFGVSDYVSEVTGKLGYNLKITVLGWSYIPGAGGQKVANNGSDGVNCEVSDVEQVPDCNSEGYPSDYGSDGTTDLDNEDVF